MPARAVNLAPLQAANVRRATVLCLAFLLPAYSINSLAALGFLPISPPVAAQLCNIILLTIGLNLAIGIAESTRLGVPLFRVVRAPGKISIGSFPITRWSCLLYTSDAADD